jgi:hypothetical protein
MKDVSIFLGWSSRKISTIRLGQKRFARPSVTSDQSACSEQRKKNDRQNGWFF